MISVAIGTGTFVLNWFRRQEAPSRTPPHDPSDGSSAGDPPGPTEEGSRNAGGARTRQERVDPDVKWESDERVTRGEAPRAGVRGDRPDAMVESVVGEAPVKEVAADTRAEAEVDAAFGGEARDVEFGGDATPRRGSATVVCVANQKGGVGKTTTAISLAAALAEAGARVLLVDLDPQGNATTGLGFRVVEGDPSTYTVLIDGMPIEDAVQATAIAGLDLLPSSLDLAGAEIELVPAFARESRLDRALDSVRDGYQVVIVDCPPTLGLLTINALAAADGVLLPIQCEYYALEGVSQLLRSLDLVRRNLNESLRLGGVILTMYDGRTRLSQQVVDEVRRHFGARVFRTIIPRSVRLSEAPSFGEPITTFDRASRGALAYLRLADEFAERLGIGLRPLSPSQRARGDDGDGEGDARWSNLEGPVYTGASGSSARRGEQVDD